MRRNSTHEKILDLSRAIAYGTGAWIPAFAGMTQRAAIQSKFQIRNSKFVIALALLLLLAPVTFAAGSFDSRLSKAHSMLANGDAEGAISAYHELQTEDPESEVLYYSMGCAQYEQGKKLVEQNAAKDSVDSFKAAQASFERTQNARDPEIRTKAQYNHANALAQIAINSADARQYKESIKAFDQSVKEYRAFLKQHPRDRAAQQNLIHTIYEYQKRLQNPPPPQEGQQGQDGQNKDDKDQNKKQDQQKQDQQQNQQDQQKKDEDKKQDDQADKDKDKQQQQQQGQSAKQDDKNQQKPDTDAQKPDDKQNVEAILQSLEDTDKREQKEEKNVRTSVETSKDWW